MCEHKKGMDDRIYLYFSSDSSSTEVRFINSNELHFELFTNIQLNGEWECALIEFHVRLKSACTFGEYIDILCDIVDGTSTNFGCQSLLRRIICNSSNKTRLHFNDLSPRFVRVKLLNLYRISFHIFEHSHRPRIDLSVPLFLVLELRRKQ